MLTYWIKEVHNMAFVRRVPVLLFVLLAFLKIPLLNAQG